MHKNSHKKWPSRRGLHSPFCVAALIGVVAGGGIDLGFQAASNLIAGCEPLDNINWGSVAINAAVGGAAPGLSALKSVGRAKGVVSAASAVTHVQLGRQLALQQQLREAGTVIAGVGTTVRVKQAGRLAQQYGGEAADWVKKTSSHYKGPDGINFETHWFENVSNGLRVEYKPKVFWES